jgi:hypothetical protein
MDELERLRALESAVTAYRQALDLYTAAMREELPGDRPDRVQRYEQARELMLATDAREAEMFAALDRLTDPG